MPFLPPRPLKLQRSFLIRAYFWGILWVLVGLGVGGAYLVWQYRDAARVIADGEVWEHGTPAELGSVRGTQRSRYGIFKEYSLDVSYTDTSNLPHNDHFTFSTLFGGVDDDAQPTLRFDPQDNSRYAISWAVECTKSRWASIGFMSIVGALIGVAILSLGAILLKRARTAQRVAATSEEVECLLLSATEQIVNGRPNGHIVYRFVVPALAPLENDNAGYRANAVRAETATASRNHEAIMQRSKGEPFFTQRGAGGDLVLVLVSRENPKDVLLLRYDLYPLDLSEDQKAAALARAA